MLSVSALGNIPVTALEWIKANHLPGQSLPMLEPAPGTGINTQLPGASMLPASVGSKLTVKNALLGAALAVTGYLAYSVFFAPVPKKKPPTPAASTTAAIAGLLGVRYRRRSRRRR